MRIVGLTAILGSFLIVAGSGFYYHDVVFARSPSPSATPRPIPRRPPGNRPAVNGPAVNVNTHFIGGTDDGSGIRRKKPNRNGQLPSNQNSVITVSNSNSAVAPANNSRRRPTKRRPHP